MKNVMIAAIVGVAAASASAGAQEAEMRQLAQRPAQPGDAVRQRFHETGDLHAFVHDVLPAASAGDGRAQYHVYRALEECRSYLRLSAAEGQAQHERLLAIDDAWSSAEEDRSLEHTHRRCRGFAGGDWGPLLEAMGPEAPRAESEYASLWFERAAASGYPPALADLGLRPFELDASERRALLQRAAASGDADVFLQLFRYAAAGHSAPSLPAPALVWLILACRAGADCSADAPWFRPTICERSNTTDLTHCVPGRSALEHYWLSRAPDERRTAYREALLAEVELRNRRFDRLSWPNVGLAD